MKIPIRCLFVTSYICISLLLPYNKCVLHHQNKIKHALGITTDAPLTEEEILEAARRRVELIDKEFTETFKFIIKYPKTVTFFGSARFSENNLHYIKAEVLAKKLSSLGYTVVTGGGPGIMEAANRGAFEAKGPSIGFNIKLPHEQNTNKYATDHLDYYYFFARKVALSFAAEAFLFFPGGFGTLNEFFEILTLVETKKVSPMPIVLVGSDYWQPIQNLIREHLYQNHNMIAKEDMDLYTITDDEEKIIEIVKNARLISNIRFPEKPSEPVE